MKKSSAEDKPVRSSAKDETKIDNSEKKITQKSEKDLQKDSFVVRGKVSPEEDSTERRTNSDIKKQNCPSSKNLQETKIIDEGTNFTKNKSRFTVEIDQNGKGTDNHRGISHYSFGDSKENNEEMNTENKEKPAETQKKPRSKEKTVSKISKNIQNYRIKENDSFSEDGKDFASNNVHNNFVKNKKTFLHLKVDKKSDLRNFVDSKFKLFKETENKNGKDSTLKTSKSCKKMSVQVIEELQRLPEQTEKSILLIRQFLKANKIENCIDNIVCNTEDMTFSIKLTREVSEERSQKPNSTHHQNVGFNDFQIFPLFKMEKERAASLMANSQIIRYKFVNEKSSQTQLF